MFEINHEQKKIEKKMHFGHKTIIGPRRPGAPPPWIR